MSLNVFEKKIDYLGLHINSHSLKCIQFNKKRNKISLMGYVNSPMPKDLIMNDSFINSEELSGFIERALSRADHGNFTTKHAMVSIPESKSFIRVIPMKKIPEEQIGNAVLFEAESYIPLPMDQVYFDWEILTSSENELSVLVVAVPKDYIDSYTAILEKAGVTISAFEVETQSISRALVPRDFQEFALIVDVDADKTNLIMVKSGALQFTSSVALGGNIFTEKLSKSLGITAPEAEKLKREIGMANTVEYPNLRSNLITTVQDLSVEIKDILKFHYDHSDAHISQIILSGGGAKLQHVDEVLAPMLVDYRPLTVSIANPLQFIPSLAKNSLTDYEALSFATAIGLSLRAL